MRQAIETAPKNQNFVIIEDTVGSNDIAQWSNEIGQWASKNGEPSKITPTHWRPIPVDEVSSKGAPSERDDDVNRVLNLLIGNPLETEESALDHNPISDGSPRDRSAQRRGTVISIAVILAVATITVALYADFQSARGPSQIAHGFVEKISAWLSRIPRPDYGRRLELARDNQPLGPVADESSARIIGPPAEASQEKMRQPSEPMGVSPSAGRSVELQREAAAAVQMLAREQEKTGTLTRDLQTAKQALTSSETQYHQSLEELRKRNNALEGELGSTRAELASKAATLTVTTDELAQSKKNSQAEAAKQEQFVQLEQDGAAVANDLSASRKEIQAKDELLRKTSDELAELKDTAKKSTSEVQEVREALQWSRDHSDALTRDLAAARQEIQTKTELVAKARDEALLKNAADAKAIELKQSLQRERDESATSARNPAAAQHVSESEVIPARTANRQTTQTQAGATVIAQPKVSASRDNEEMARLITHASALLAQGDIGAGRSFLERAVEAGSVEASFALAETYDPHVLSRWGTYGTRGDVSKARELYAKAMSGGIEEARKRLKALGE